MCRTMIKAAGVPVAAPSGNLSGKPSPTTARHMLDDMEQPPRLLKAVHRAAQPLHRVVLKPVGKLIKADNTLPIAVPHMLQNILRAVDWVSPHHGHWGFREHIWAHCPDTAGMGLAVVNRLSKAAGFHIVEA